MNRENCIMLFTQRHSLNPYYDSHESENMSTPHWMSGSNIWWLFSKRPQKFKKKVKSFSILIKFLTSSFISCFAEKLPKWCNKKNLKFWHSSNKNVSPYRMEIATNSISLQLHVNCDSGFKRFRLLIRKK